MTKKIFGFGASGKTGTDIWKQLTVTNIQHTAFIRKGSEIKLKI